MKRETHKKWNIRKVKHYYELKYKFPKKYNFIELWIKKYIGWSFLPAAKKSMSVTEEFNVDALPMDSFLSFFYFFLSTNCNIKKGVWNCSQRLSLG